MLNNVTGLWRFLGGFAGMYVMGHIFGGKNVRATGLGHRVLVKRCENFLKKVVGKFGS